MQGNQLMPQREFARNDLKRLGIGRLMGEVHKRAVELQGKALEQDRFRNRPHTDQNLTNPFGVVLAALLGERMLQLFLGDVPALNQQRSEQISLKGEQT
jgi:hypothetical protein